jgi:predicted PurR-regulated permease PerM
MNKLYRIIYKSGVVLFCTILFIYALVQARTLLYPIALAVLFSYLLYPIGKWLEKHGCHRILANCIIIFGCLAVMLGVAYVLYSEVGLLIRSLPDLREHAQRNIHAISDTVSGGIGVSTDEFRKWANAQIHDLSENGNLFIDIIFPSTAGTVMALGLVPVYIFLFLYYRNKLYNFLIMIWPDQKKTWLHHTVEEISLVTRRYLGGVFTVVGILCIINSAGLWFLDVKFALLLGILSALCNFVPYFGVWIGAIFPLTMAIFTGDSPQQTIGVLILFIVVDLVENNLLTPNITGGSVQVNPLVTIIGIIAAGMTWGIPGMFVIIPLLGILKIVLDNNETTKPVGFLIGTDGTGKHAITWRNLKGFFKRHNGTNKKT